MLALLYTGMQVHVCVSVYNFLMILHVQPVRYVLVKNTTACTLYIDPSGWSW